MYIFFFCAPERSEGAQKTRQPDCVAVRASVRGSAVLFVHKTELAEF